MKNSSDTIENRPRDLPVCSTVPPTPRHRVPHIQQYTTYVNLHKGGNVRINVTLRRVRVTTVTVEKQEVLNNLTVCLQP
jgi:hypothetical protein